VPQHVGGGLPDHPPEDGVHRARQRLPSSRRPERDAGRGQRRPRLGEGLGEADLPVAAHRVTDLGQRPPRGGLDVGHLLPGPDRVVLGQPAGELALERDQRQAVAQQVVEVTGEAQSLLGDGVADQLLAGLDQFGVDRDEVPHPAKCEAGQQTEERKEEDGAEQAVRGEHAGADHR
jgi:hypothetical protein